MSFWEKLVTYRTRTYRKKVPKKGDLIMCQLITKDEHGFRFKLVDYSDLEGRLTFKNAHAKRRKKTINKLFTSHDKLYPIRINSVEYRNYSTELEKLKDFDDFEDDEFGCDGSDSDPEEPESESEEESEGIEEEEEEEIHYDESEKPYIMLSNLGLSEEKKTEFKKSYNRYLQILGLVHKFAINSFKKAESKSRPDQMSSTEQEALFKKYQLYVEDLVQKTIWKLSPEKVYDHFHVFKNKFKEDQVFDIDSKQKKELATLVRKTLRDPDYTLDYFFELTTIRFSLNPEESGYHFLRNLFRKALEAHHDQIKIIDPKLTIEMKNLSDLNQDGKVINQKNKKAISYSIHGTSKNENSLRELAEDIINTIQKLKGPFENFKKLEISLHNSETRQTTITKF